MKDMGCRVIEKYVDYYNYKIGATVEKADGLYIVTNDGLKKIYDNNGPEERMVLINHKIYFDLEKIKIEPPVESKELRSACESFPGVLPEEEIKPTYEELKSGIACKDGKAYIMPIPTARWKTIAGYINENNGYPPEGKDETGFDEVVDAHATEGNLEKPPLGIKPKPIHDQERSNDLVEAIERHLSTGTRIPLEWIEEFNEFFK